MIDEIYDRHYQQGRDQLNAAINAGVGRFVRAAANAFKVLQRIEYDSPWTAKAQRVRCN